MAGQEERTFFRFNVLSFSSFVLELSCAAVRLFRAIFGCYESGARLQCFVYYYPLLVFGDAQLRWLDECGVDHHYAT